MFSSMYPERYKTHIKTCTAEVMAWSSSRTYLQQCCPSFDELKWRQLLLKQPEQAMEQLKQAYVLRRNTYNITSMKTTHSDGVFMAYAGLDFDEGTYKEAKSEFLNEDALPPFATWLLVGSVGDLTMGYPPQNPEPVPYEPSQMFLLSWVPSYLFDDLLPVVRRLWRPMAFLNDPELLTLMNDHLTQHSQLKVSLNMPDDVPKYERLFE